MILPRRTNPAARVVDRCQCSKVGRSSADRIMRKADLRPRAMAISSHRCLSSLGRDTSMPTHRQANLHIFS